MRSRLLVVAVGLVIGLAVYIWWRSPGSDRPPIIQVGASELLVHNQSRAAWSDIEIWVNDQYRGLVPSVMPGQVLNVPLRSLVAGYGQRFEPGRQAVRGVLVKARRGDGTPVRLTWGSVRRK